MDYPGLTTYEPTWAHLLIIYIIVVLLTYPCSLFLILLGVITPGKFGLTKSKTALAFNCANEILKTQSGYFVYAWLAGCLLTVFSLCGCAVVYCLLLWLGLMERGGNTMTPALLIGCFVHLLTQGYGYWLAIEEHR